MSVEAVAQPSAKSFSDPAFKKRLQELRQTDNYRNWFYLIRTYAVLAAAIGGALWFYGYQAVAEISWWWNVPVSLAAIMVVGAVQHQMATLAHEAVHHTLFKNRYLNDLMSEWCCSFPMFSSTFHYGLHHLAHHQFVNDPVRDPDISQMQLSGHRLSFPILKQEFLNVLMRQLWIPNLMRYSFARAEYDSLGTEHNPYIKKDWKFTKLPSRMALGYLGALVVALTALVIHGDPWLLTLVPAGMWLALMIAYAALPERFYYQSKIRPLFSVRSLGMMRATFFTFMFGGLAWGTWATGNQWWGLYFFLLWIVPLLTSFPLYMVLRQIVQHGNADRGWLTNSRVFHCNPLINYAVFPMGQDYHLPHHMFATVPHYRLKELHELMLQYPEYREGATVVEGYFVPKHRPPTKPTVVDALGPEYAPAQFNEVFIDNTVLEDLDQNQLDEGDREDILREGQQEADRVRAEAVGE